VLEFDFPNLIKTCSFYARFKTEILVGNLQKYIEAKMFCCTFWDT